MRSVTWTPRCTYREKMTIRDALSITLKPMLIAVTAAVIIRVTCFQLFSIPSKSMAPTLLPGDQIVVTPYRLPFSHEPRRGDVVVFRHPADGRFLVKRIVGLPGDYVEISGTTVRVNGAPLEEPYAANMSDELLHGPEIVPADAYFVLGDNRSDSVDSRVWGAIAHESLVGRVRAILWSAGSPENTLLAEAESRSATRAETNAVRLFRPVH